MSVEMKENGEKRMHVEIIKYSTKNENAKDPTLDCDNLCNEPGESVLQEQKMLNHSGEIATNSQMQNSHASKELKLTNGLIINGKDKDITHNGNHVISNSKVVKPKEYKFCKIKGRWICKDTKEIKNEGREIVNDLKANLPPSGKIVNSHPTPIVMTPQIPDLLEEVNFKQTLHPTPSPLLILDQPLPVHANKFNITGSNHSMNSAANPLEHRINSIFKETWDNCKQGVVQNLTIMYQQETQSLNDRIRQLIGVLSELQKENIALRSELENYRSHQHPPH